MTQNRLYTLSEARKIIEKQDREHLCQMHGHSWDVISTVAGPTSIHCSTCFLSYVVAATPAGLPGVPIPAEQMLVPFGIDAADWQVYVESCRRADAEGCQWPHLPGREYREPEPPSRPSPTTGMT